MRRCRHCAMMEAFDQATQAWWDAAEAETKLYPTELAEYKREHPMPQLGEFMSGQY